METECLDEDKFRLVNKPSGVTLDLGAGRCENTSRGWWRCPAGSSQQWENGWQLRLCRLGATPDSNLLLQNCSFNGAVKKRKKTLVLHKHTDKLYISHRSGATFDATPQISQNTYTLCSFSPCLPLLVFHSHKRVDASVSRPDRERITGGSWPYGMTICSKFL